MNSSPRHDEAEPVSVREGGIPYRPGTGGDSFQRWLELMEVVEALCPRWPERNRITTGEFLL